MLYIKAKNLERIRFFLAPNTRYLGGRKFLQFVTIQISAQKQVRFNVKTFFCFYSFNRFCSICYCKKTSEDQKIIFTLNLNGEQLQELMQN